MKICVGERRFKGLPRPGETEDAMNACVFRRAARCGSVVGIGVAVSLGIIDMAGQRIDEIAGQVGAIGRCQRRVLFALEVIVNDELAAIAGKNEIDTGAFEVSAEQQLRIGNDDRVGRNMRGVNRFRIKMSAWVLTQRIRDLGIKFAEVIHPAATAMVNKYIISKI